jgi:hypothetical protein
MSDYSTLLLLMYGRFLHVSVQRGHLHVIRISKITMKRHWVLGGFYANEISFARFVGLYLFFDIFPVLHTQTAPPPLTPLILLSSLGNCSLPPAYLGENDEQVLSRNSHVHKFSIRFSVHVPFLSTRAVSQYTCRFSPEPTSYS